MKSNVSILFYAYLISIISSQEISNTNLIETKETTTVSNVNIETTTEKIEYEYEDDTESPSGVKPVDDSTSQTESVQNIISPTTKKWIYQVPRIPKKYDPSHTHNIIKSEALVSSGTDPNSIWSSNQTNWIWISTVFYELMNNFAVLETNNKECRKHSELYVKNLKNLTVWAMKMRDATVLSPIGILDTSYWQLGNYDECVGLQLSNYGFEGKYCIPSLKFKPRSSYYPRYHDGDHSKDYGVLQDDVNAWDAFRENIDPRKVTRNELHWAMCIPSSCTTNDLESTLQSSFDLLSQKYPIDFKVNVDQQYCFHESQKQYSTGFWVFTGFTAFTVVIVIFSSLYDVMIVRTEFFKVNQTLKTWTLPFSAPRNLEKLWKNNESQEFSVIHGLKTISIFQVIMGHRVLGLLGNVLVNPHFTETKVALPIWGYFNNGTLFVDNFFVIGGFLTFYYLFKELEDRKGRVNFPGIFIYRTLRITPLYMYVVAFYMYFLPYIGDGPLWESIIGRESMRCQKNWWLNLLYLHNYFHEDEECMIQAWYLACDFHFFIVGTLVTFISWKYRKVALPLLISLMVFFIVMPSYVIYNGKHWGVIKTYISHMRDSSADPEFQDVYIKSHMRAFPYVFGLFCGYLYIRMKEVNYKIPFAWKWTISGIFGIIGHLPFFIPQIFYIPGRPYNALENAIFFSAQRLIWNPIVGFIIIGHATTGLGFASRMVGHRLFVPLGRLTFCAYLSHVAFQLVDIAGMRSPNFMSYTNSTLGVYQDLLVTFAAALVLNLLIESPLDRFQKAIVKTLITGEKVKLNKKKPLTDSVCHIMDSSTVTLQNDKDNLGLTLNIENENSLSVDEEKI